MMDPIKRIQEDRQDARSHDDPNADLCTLALAENNRPSVRTLVLREVSEEGFILYISKTSPKWTVIHHNPVAELLLWYTHSQTQYRISGTITEIDKGIVDHHWLRRPAASKFMDHSYKTIGAQSSPIESRQVLVGHINQMREDLDEETLTAPDTAAGVLIKPETIELLDLNMPNRIHDRRRFTRTQTGWLEQQLIP